MYQMKGKREFLYNLVIRSIKRKLSIYWDMVMMKVQNFKHIYIQYLG